MSKTTPPIMLGNLENTLVDMNDYISKHMTPMSFGKQPKIYSYTPIRRSL